MLLNTCGVTSMKKDAYEVLMESLIEHATPLSPSVHPCHDHFIPYTQVFSLNFLVFAAVDLFCHVGF